MKLKHICIRPWQAPSGETRLSETTSSSGLSPPQSTLTLFQVSPGNHTLTHLFPNFLSHKDAA